MGRANCCTCRHTPSLMRVAHRGRAEDANRCIRRPLVLLIPLCQEEQRRKERSTERGGHVHATTSGRSGFLASRMCSWS